MNLKLIHNLLRVIYEVKSADDSVFLVGGAVRDQLLDIALHDLDFVVQGDSISLARKVAHKLKGVFFILDPVRRTARVIYNNNDECALTLDFALMQGATIEEDLQRRDFTINAIAVDIQNPSVLIDPLKGKTALKKRRIILCSPNSIVDDPLRILRAIRLKLQMDLEIDGNLEKEIINKASLLANISSERIRDELFLLIENSNFCEALEVMIQMKIFDEIFLYPLGTNASLKQNLATISKHTLFTIDNLYNIRNETSGFFSKQKYENKEIHSFFSGISNYRKKLISHLENPITESRTRFSLLVLAALFHDAGIFGCKAVDWDGTVHYYRHEHHSSHLAARFGDRIILSKAESQFLASVVLNHTKPFHLARQSGEIGPRGIYRFFLSVGEEGIDTALLSIADYYAKDPFCEPKVEHDQFMKVILALFDAWWNKRTKIVNPKLLLRGDQIMKKFKLSSGPLIGTLLAVLKEAQASGNVHNQKEAYQFLQKLIEKDVRPESIGQYNNGKLAFYRIR